MSVRIQKVHHIAIMAPAALIEQTLQFYTDVLGLSIGARPPFSVPGYWLYAASTPVVHLTVNEARHAGASGYLHHIAFQCDDISTVIQRLDELGMPYRRNDIEAISVRQVMLQDPAGNAIEIVCTT